MAQFTVDLKGRINNTHLPEYKALWPLFEAVVNSIQSLEDSSHATDKLIEIFAQRQDFVQLSTNEHAGNRNELSPFESFFVTDNGNGFKRENYESFRTADSSLKWKKGCKGIGRFLWLKAFEKVEITSVFFEDDKWQKRQFAFDINGIIPDDNLVDSFSTDYKTTVALYGFKANYREKCPLSLEVLAKK